MFYRPVRGDMWEKKGDDPLDRPRVRFQNVIGT
jgi:hypothetical protein